MMRVERHPRVDADVDEALAFTLREFGPDQVPVYEHLMLASKEALEQREAYEDRVKALRRAGEEGLASLREHGPQLESDADFEKFMDEAEAEALR